MEEWRLIKGFEDYLISSLGRCKSLKGGKERILSETINNEGYIHYGLRKDGKRFTRKAHRLVASAFLGESKQVNHINGVRWDNRLINLELSDNSHNQKHAFRVLGKSVKGTKNPRAILNVQKVKEIRKLGLTKMPRKVIAEKYGVKLVTIEKILARKIWN